MTEELALKSSQPASRKAKPGNGGKLKIGDDWNAIRIIALSQSNPLKAIAEFVENSIDAHAKTIAITRGREHGQHYLSIRDDGEGVPRDDEGEPPREHLMRRVTAKRKTGSLTREAATGRCRRCGHVSFNG
jgi:hypothetical protein